MSLSARRAWIEISDILSETLSSMSLSARRAWIEILTCWSTKPIGSVALRKESVDRNFNAVQIVIVVVSRSPQGERG